MKNAPFINCPTCLKDFQVTHKTQKYCSTQCARKNRVLTEKHIENSRLGLLNYYKTTDPSGRKDRNRKIREARVKKFSEEEITKITAILKLGYVIDGDIVLKKAGIFDKSSKILKNYKKQHPEWYPQFRLVKCLSFKIQEWSEEKMLEFKKDCEKYDHAYMEKKYEIGFKTFKRLTHFYGLTWGKISMSSRRGETKPERIIRELLIELGIEFQREKYILHQKFRVDFLLPDKKVLEVNGDYWHANPKIYDYNFLTTTQKSNVVRDIEKNRFIADNGYKLLEVWEYDINRNLEKIKQQILNYVQS